LLCLNLLTALAVSTKAAGGRSVLSRRIDHHPVEGDVEVDAAMGLRNGKRKFKVSRVNIPRKTSGYRPFSMSLSKKIAFPALSIRGACSILFG
jgi:hypothetical protein